ncbi:MAG: hypothetical protein HZB29_04375 [Nitrospinae bacterium]|nr:hypothetical protein [Nitrospinota bacterium]
MKNYKAALAAVCLAIFIASFWIVTQGQWKLFAPVAFQPRYEAQAKSLLEGRLDVPDEAARPEAFYDKGNAYLYWGLAPALLRVPVIALFPEYGFNQSRVIFLLASAAALLMAVCILRTTHVILFGRQFDTGKNAFIFSVYILVLSLGSTNIFLLSFPEIHNEAVLLGSTFTLIALFFLLKLKTRPSSPGRYVFLAFVAALFAAHTRFAVSLGIFAAFFAIPLFGLLSGLFQRKKGPPADAQASFFTRDMPAGLDIKRIFAVERSAAALRPLALLLCALALPASFMFVNYLKWESVSGQPVDKASAEMLRAAHNDKNFQSITIYNVRSNVYNYFAPDKIGFSREYPWILPARNVTPFPENRWSASHRPFISMTASAPLLLLLAIAGLAGIYHRLRSFINYSYLIILSAFCGAAPVLGFGSLDFRYLHDMYPFIVLSSAAGVSVLANVNFSKAWRLSVFSVIALLAVYEVAVNVLYSYQYSRENHPVNSIRYIYNFQNVEVPPVVKAADINILDKERTSRKDGKIFYEGVSRDWNDCADILEIKIGDIGRKSVLLIEGFLWKGTFMGEFAGGENVFNGRVDAGISGPFKGMYEFDPGHYDSKFVVYSCYQRPLLSDFQIDRAVWFAR